MDNNQKRLKVLNEQLLATILFIGSLLISISLTVDTKKKIKKEKRYYTDESAKSVAIINRTFVILIVLFYIQIDKENIEIAREKNGEINLLYLQEIIEYITLTTAIVALYISIKSSPNNGIASTENPTI